MTVLCSPTFEQPYTETLPFGQVGCGRAWCDLGAPHAEQEQGARQAERRVHEAA